MRIESAAEINAFDANTGPIDPNGVGVSRGSNNYHNIGLVPVTRPE